MKRTPLKRKTRLNPVSKKRAKELASYRRKRAAFLRAHPCCEAWLFIWNRDLEFALQNPLMLGVPAATDIHHVKGRGKYLNDESTWLAVSRTAHIWIHNNPSKARALGLLQ